jgi:hypothetical protein
LFDGDPGEGIFARGEDHRGADGVARADGGQVEVQHVEGGQGLSAVVHLGGVAAQAQVLKGTQPVSAQSDC